MKIRKFGMHTSAQNHPVNTLHSVNLAGPFLARYNLFFTVLGLACLALAPAVRAVSPAPDGGYANNNTAEGEDALFRVTTGGDNTALGFNALIGDSTGTGNTATGARALFSNSSGNNNTATGRDALGSNNGSDNTANGKYALTSNTSGSFNTATGSEALDANTNGSYNTAAGSGALYVNKSGGGNVANGYLALQANLSGFYNMASGAFALGNNINGSYNVASGTNALYYNRGSSNTANGHQALQNNTTGNNNVAIGYQAGNSLTTGSNNIVIGAGVLGQAGEANTTRIGKNTQKKTFIGGIAGKTVASGVGVIINSSGQLGTVLSSARFKEAIKPMDETSEALLALQPVTFRYKEELDPEKIPQFGLIAEEVEKIDPDLVVRDEEGKVSTVRYEAVNAMLLNEFLKEHRKVEELERKVRKQKETSAQQTSELRAAVASQRSEIETLTATVQQVRNRVEFEGSTRLLEVSTP